MRIEVCSCTCRNTKCRYNSTNVKNGNFLVYMAGQIRCEGYLPPEPEKKTKPKTVKRAQKRTGSAQKRTGIAQKRAESVQKHTNKEAKKGNENRSRRKNDF